LAEADEVGFHPVGDPEIEVAAVGLFEEARTAEILVLSFCVDVGPEIAGGIRDAGLAG